MAKDIETVLKNFVQHVIALSEESDPAGTGFHREFRILRETQIQNKSDDRFPTEDGRKEDTIKKNRYKDILPRDDRRVKLTEIPGEKGSDYINATFIDDVDGHHGYIAAQGPMPHTVNDFWRMLWQYNTEIVFMACRLKEEGRAKCENYWAANGDRATFGEITVHAESEEEIQDHFIKRHLRVEKDGETKELTQFHYMGWPDHNTPSSPDVLRTMIEDVRIHRKRLNIPMVVHCSAGCGRTGTICAIDFAWTLLDRGMIDEEFSMFEIIKCLREQRMSMVQTPDQYEYTHMVMKSLCNEWLASFKKHDYENVVIGRPIDEEPEETYYNVDFHQDQSNSRDSTGSSKEQVVSISEVPKENVKLTRSSKPALSEKPEIKQQKPEILKQKPQIGATIQTKSRTQPQTITIPASNQVNNDAGEYVEVRTTAALSPSSPPPSLPSKKNPPLNTTNLDPHKTVITLGGANTQPKIVKTGSVGVSSTKQQAPKPPAAQVVKPPAVSSAATAKQQQQKQQQQQESEDGTMYGQVVKIKPLTKRQVTHSAPAYENFEIPLLQNAGSSADQTTPNYANSASVNNSPQDAPDLPVRQYKPEEIAQSGSSPSADTDARSKNTYDNVVPISPSSPSHALPSPKVNQNRAPQPLPNSQSPPRSAAVQGVGVSSRPAGHQAPAKKTAGHIPGMVRAIGGQPQPVGHMERRGSAKSDTRVKGSYPTQPVTRQGHPAGLRGAPGMIPQSRAPHSAESSSLGSGIFKQIFPRKHKKGGRNKLFAAPTHPNQVLQAGQGRPVQHWERLPRVNGPRDQPKEWQRKRHQQPMKYPSLGTYL